MTTDTDPKTDVVHVEVEPEIEEEFTMEKLSVIVLSDEGRTRKVIIDDPGVGHFEYVLGIPKLKHRKTIAKIAAAMRGGGNQSKIEKIAIAHGIEVEDLDKLSEDDLTPEEREILMGDETIVKTMDIFSEVIYISLVSVLTPSGEQKYDTQEEFEDKINMDHAMALFKPAMKMINASFVSGAQRKK